MVFNISWGIPLVVFANLFLFTLIPFFLVGIRSLALISLFIPFLAISSLLPNKDIFLLPFLLLFYKLVPSSLTAFEPRAKSFLRNIILIILAFLAFFIRDGAGVMLLTFVFSYPFSRRYPIISILSMFFLSWIVSHLIMESALFQNLYAVERTANRDIVYYSYPIRVLANATNYPFRIPLVSSDGLVSISAFAYTLSGFGILILNLLSVRTMLSWIVPGSLRRSLLAPPSSSLYFKASVFYLYTLLFFSVSPVIQPRYLIDTAIVVFLGIDFKHLVRFVVARRALLFFNIFIFLVIWMVYILLDLHPVLDYPSSLVLLISVLLQMCLNLLAFR